jgi:hypothetical protein
MNTLLKVITEYVNLFTHDTFHRYRSWDNCNDAFMSGKQSENHSLELAFYLASWGMYRGSSGLLQKNHLIHEGAVEILFSKAGQSIKCSPKRDITADDIDKIMEVKNTLFAYYKSIRFLDGKRQERNITPTDTLLSKIMLGSLGCVPAYDRYMVEGLKICGIAENKFNTESLNKIFDFIKYNKNDIETCQALVMSKTNKYYPVMKIIDMYLWQTGYEKTLK